MIARLVLNLLKSRDTIAVPQRFTPLRCRSDLHHCGAAAIYTIAVPQRSTAFDAFPRQHTRLFWNV